MILIINDGKVFTTHSDYQATEIIGKYPGMEEKNWNGAAPEIGDDDPTE
jgi:hypothetical protein